MKIKFFSLSIICIGLLCVTEQSHAARSRLRKANDQNISNNQQSFAIDDNQTDQLPSEELAIQTVEQENEPEVALEPEVVVQAPNEPQAVQAPSDVDGSSLMAEGECDEEAKKKEVMALVERGADFLSKNAASVAFRMFTHTGEFDKGELYLFVLDLNGVCYADGQEPSFLWKNLIDLQDIFGVPIVKNLIAKAKEGGGWVTYNWRNATKVSYVKLVKKEDKTYVISCGYYPHSKKNAVINLVKGACAYFNEVKSKGFTKDIAFSTISYPMGRFVSGDLYLYALDFKGTLMAQGDRPGLIGTNVWNVKGSDGKLTNQEIITKLKTAGDEGVWVSYVSKNAVKYAYAEKVTDSQNNNYAIICGYYPDANRDKAIELVKKGYSFMKAHGKSEASAQFTDRNNLDFRYGDLNLFVYDYKGICIASGANPEFVGQNHYDFQDEDGRYYVREIILKAQEGGGWMDYKMKNSFQSTYIEPIDFGLQEKYVIGCGTFPITKGETMSLLVKSGTSYLKVNSDEKAMQEFTRANGRFIRGDLSLFVFDPTGLCYASGDDYDLIWQNLINKKDDDGKPYVKLFINTVKQGAAKITYALNKNQKVAYVDRVDKADKTFIVGSSFYK